MKLSLIIIFLTLFFFGSYPLVDDVSPKSQFLERERVPSNKVSKKDERFCLTQAIYYEAGNQSHFGKEAVALVVMNRVRHPLYPKTVCEVVREKHVVQGKTICQFSFWCEPKRKPTKEVWKESAKISNRVLRNYWQRDILLRYQDAIFFHANYVKPKWRINTVFLGKIDEHLFYKERS